MIWTWIRSWWRTEQQDRSGWQVTLYTRQGCHLCEGVWEQLQMAQQRHGFSLKEVDVDTDPQLVQLYGNCVPVVTINGKLRFRGGMSPVLLRRILEAGSP